MWIKLSCLYKIPERLPDYGRYLEKVEESNSCNVMIMITNEMKTLVHLTCNSLDMHFFTNVAGDVRPEAMADQVNFEVGVLKDFTQALYHERYLNTNHSSIRTGSRVDSKRAVPPVH